MFGKKLKLNAMAFNFNSRDYWFLFHLWFQKKNCHRKKQPLTATKGNYSDLKVTITVFCFFLSVLFTWLPEKKRTASFDYINQSFWIV